VLNLKTPKKRHQIKEQRQIEQQNQVLNNQNERSRPGVATLKFDLIEKKKRRRKKSNRIHEIAKKECKKKYGKTSLNKERERDARGR